MTDNTTRRAVLGAIPVIAAVPAAAAVPVADPIHDVIARYRMAWDAQCAAWLHVSRMQEAHAAPVGWRDGPEPLSVTRALQMANDADEALDNATETLVSTSPTTAAGVAAVLKVVAEFVARQDFDGNDRFLSDDYRLPRLLRRLAGALNGETS